MAKDDDLIGKIKEKVGWLTGDRKAEAEGKVRRVTSGPDDEFSEEEVAAAEAEATRQVRQTYGEYDPAVDGAPEAADVRPAD